MATIKDKLLNEANSYEEIFRGAGVVEYERTRGEGEEATTSLEQIDFTVKEFIGTRDAVWMFPRVVQKTLIEAAEPQYQIVPLLNVVRINTGVRTVDYMAVGALQAFEIPEGQEYPTDDLAWSTGAKTAKVTKKGLRIPITDEMIEDSQFDLIAMYLRAAGKAMARFKEALAVEKFLAAATTLRNNEVADADFNPTKGVGPDGVHNGTLDAQDLLEVIGEMLANGSSATHVLMHPLAWTMWAQDPIIKNLSWYTGGLFSPHNMRTNDDNTPTNGGYQGFIQSTVPMGFQVITTPYLDVRTADSGVTTTDILIIDANDVGALTVREDMSTEQFDDPTRDIISLKVKERYDITIFPSTGYNICKLEDVVVARNYGREVAFNVALDGTDFTDTDFTGVVFS